MQGCALLAGRLTGLDWTDRAEQPRVLMAVLWVMVRQDKQLMAVLLKLCATTDLFQSLTNSDGPLHKGVWIQFQLTFKFLEIDNM